MAPWRGTGLQYPGAIEVHHRSVPGYRTLKPAYRTQPYRTQGFGKFGFYEGFKVLYANLVGDEIAYQYRYTVGDMVDSGITAAGFYGGGYCTYCGL